MPTAPRNAWRLRQIILPQEIDEELYHWHGGQGSSVYALASTGQSHLVSLSMIDAALRELGSVRVTGRDRAALRRLIGELQGVRQFWREHSAHEAGMSVDDEGYDARDYGLSPADEAAIRTRSG